MHIRKATIRDLELIIPLFDKYRQFYRQPSNKAGARIFIKDRLSNQESIILLVFYNKEETHAIGFTQLYPIFSSVTMEPMLLLNDLYIAPDYRGQGMGTSLINNAKDVCKVTLQKGIIIQTETTNPAQKLYERLGFNKDPDLHYFWAR